MTSATTSSIINFILPVPLRALPSATGEYSSTLSHYAVTRPGVADYTASAISLSTTGSTRNIISLTITHSATAGAGVPVIFQANNNAAAYIGVSAEL